MICWIILVFCGISLCINSSCGVPDGDIIIESVNRIISFNSLIREDKFDYYFNDVVMESKSCLNFEVIFPLSDSERFLSFRAILDDNKTDLKVERIPNYSKDGSRNNNKYFMTYIIELPPTSEIEWKKLSVYVSYSSVHKSPVLDETLPFDLNDVVRYKTHLGTYSPYPIRIQAVSFLDMDHINKRINDVNLPLKKYQNYRSQGSELLRAYISTDRYIKTPRNSRPVDGIEYLYGFDDEKNLLGIDMEAFLSGIVLGYAQPFAASWNVILPKMDIDASIDEKRIGKEVSYIIHNNNFINKLSQNDSMFYNKMMSSLYLVIGLNRQNVGLFGDVKREIKITRFVNSYLSIKTGELSRFLISNVKDTYSLLNKRATPYPENNKGYSGASIRKVDYLIVLLDRVPVMHKAYDKLGKIYTTSVKEIIDSIGQVVKLRYPLEGGFKAKFTTERVEETLCASYLDPLWRGNFGYICELRPVPQTIPVIDLQSLELTVHYPYGAKGCFLLIDGIRYDIDNYNSTKHPSFFESYPTYPNCQVEIDFEEESGFLEVFGKHKVIHIKKNHCSQRDTANNNIEIGYYLPNIGIGPIDTGLISQFIVPIALSMVVVIVLKVLI